MFSKKNIDDFFDVVLKGESKTYNDHNYYTNNGLRSYIQGGYGQKYPKLRKELSNYTIGEIKKFQANTRDNIGQLWATGRYQIIPSTLKEVSIKAGLNDSEKYSPKNQDKLAFQLLMNRSYIRDYITKKIPDNKENLEKASLSMAKIWSSIGVPYRTQGSNKYVEKDESYYSGGGDKASVSSKKVQDALKKLRNSINNIQQKENNKGVIIGTGIIITTLIIAGVIVYLSKNKPIKLPKFMK